MSRIAASQISGLKIRDIVLAVLLCSIPLLSRPMLAEAWPISGPEGGTARSLAYDPRDPDRMFLGTGSGAVFLSTDGGRHWSHLAQLGGADYVLDHIVTTPKESGLIFISAWSTEDVNRGDLFRSRDGGSTWESVPAMHGRSIRALAFAGTGPGALVAGALDGVYRSTNLGEAWEKISPEGDAEIKNIQSVAADPRDPNVIYAGTWHLLWKTKDGGKTWQKASRGMEYDSDIFSIILDVSNRQVLFASACSGIYRSDTAGERYRKVHDIPDSARRTHVLRQDPEDSRIIFAGTTEGLWRTVNGGSSWTRVTNRSTVVNDIVIDPRHSNRVFLATDRLGILVSADGGRTFAPSNHGYSHRYVTAIVADRSEPATFYVGVANDHESGGVFSFNREKGKWQQLNDGLGGRDVLCLEQTANGTLIAGTNEGAYLLKKNSRKWRPAEMATDDLSGSLRERAPTVKSAISEARVNYVELHDRLWWAATSVGLFKSVDEGKNWEGGSILGQQDFIAVQSLDKLLVAATASAIVISNDGGESWHPSIPPRAIRSVVLTPTGQIVIATRLGGFYSSDVGVTWQPVNGLPELNVTSMSYDKDGARLLAAADGRIFESHDEGWTWQRGPDAGLAIRKVRASSGRIVAATLDGIIIQPKTVQ